MARYKKLAILGGKKTFNIKISRYNTIRGEELAAATKVIRSGNLSTFLGENDTDFYGGKYVKAFERKCENFFKVKHAISVNSWSSGLTAALGALGIEPGDEVIVPCLTMTATATAVLHWNAIPVFADIDLQTYNIDPTSIEKNITKLTKAIICVDLFGQSVDMNAIKKISKKYNLKIISDTAQSICSKYNGKYSGTLADIGGFSLNYHKHIHTGEGGMLVTDDDELALRMKLIRNHAEAVVGGMNYKKIDNMIGYNFRMGEIESAIGIEQLKKVKKLVLEKRKWAKILNVGLKNLKGLRIPQVLEQNTHSYYGYPIFIETKTLGVSRDKIYHALLAEGVPGLSNNYALLHLLPIYQKKIAYGKNGFPWSKSIYKGNVSYKKGICPNAENFIKNNYLNLGLSLFNFNEKSLNLIIKSFHKVWDNIDKLK